MRRLILLLVLPCLLASLAGAAPPAPDSGNEPARPLTGRGLDNLVAFSRLLGYVRYFHPSDEGAAADWGGLAIAGVQRVEEAPDAAALARTLEEIFKPVAPTVRVFPSGRRPPVPEGLKPPAGGAVRTVAWRHAGLGPISYYKSFRVDDQTLSPGEPGRVEQDVDATPFRGKKVRLRAAVRAKLPPGNHASLWLSVRRPQEKKGFENAGDHPFGSGPWRMTEITGEVAPDAETIAFGLVLDRQGMVWIDDVALEIVGETTNDPHAVVNPSFEEGEAGWQPDGWDLDWALEAAGYSFSRSRENPSGGNWCGLLVGADPKSLITAKPDEPFEADLGGGVSALVPLALWADAAGTLPHAAPATAIPKPAKPAGWTPSGDDRATRLADVALAWNVFQNFFPYFDVALPEGRPDWAAVLRSSLSEAATDPDDVAFKRTMRGLVAALRDGHGAVSHRNPVEMLSVPLAFDWIEDRLVVAWADPDKAAGIRPGDSILAIDGKAAGEVLSAAEARVSAATPQHRRRQVLPSLVMGPKNQEVRLEVQPLDGPVRIVTVRCVLPYFGEGSARSGRLASRPDKIAELRPGIFYVDLGRVTGADFKAALGRLAAARGVVFDLREYPNGQQEDVLAHLTGRSLYSSQFIVPLLTRPDQQGVIWLKRRSKVVPLSPRLLGKVAFLAGAGTLSYGEGLLTLVDAYRLGAIVGGPSAGINGAINEVSLPGEYRLLWTDMKVLRPDGSRQYGVGIQPTVPVSPTRRGLAAGKDEVLEKGLDVVSTP